MSQIKSTAAFDENPQSRERGITIDLGFSAFQLNDCKKLSLTRFINSWKIVDVRLWIVLVMRR